MLLDLGALVLEMHRHGRFLPDSLQRRAAEAVGTDAQVRSLSRAVDAGDGMPDLVAAGIAGNCDRCGALHSTGAAFCSQCGNELEAAKLPRKAALGLDPELGGGAPVPRRPVAAMAPAGAQIAEDEGDAGETQVLDAPAPDVDDGDDREQQPDADDSSEGNGDGDGQALPPLPANRRARATRVRQRLDEPARPSSPLTTGLLAGIAAGVVVIVVGILILSSGGDDGGGESNRAAQAPGQREPEPPPPDEAATPRDDAANSPAAALEPVEGVTADDYDPSGDDEEHGAEAPLAVDGDVATSWPTEEYDTGSLQKDGVGLTLQPAQAVAARGLDLRTTTPGFDVTIFGAETTLPTSIADWTQIASEDAIKPKGRIDLDAAGRDFAYYLIWITKIPEDSPKVEISEARLLR